MNSGDIVLDLSRLLSRVRHHTPSGVDRVEMAYARGLLERWGSRLQFAAVHPSGLYGRLSHGKALRFLDLMERRWATEDGDVGQRSLAQVLPLLLSLLPERPPRSGAGVYVQASPHHLTDMERVRRILRRESARFLCLVHDLIPMEYPEYARPDGAMQHRRRIGTITTLADGIIANSAATARSLQPWLRQAGRHIDVRVALLGTDPVGGTGMPAGGAAEPYFLCVGTIEPRKNHLLLLNLWRSMVETQPPGTVPRLIIVGRRGWENEQVVDMLERCPALKGHVEELNGCSDRRMHELLRGARALLMPSFAEGYGMPVAEALSVGTPVLCSDLPALREAGGAAPDFLDPLDGRGWRSHIADFAAAGPLFVAQMRRIAGWHRPTWAEHIGIVCKAIADLQKISPS
jgi:glycosyltransferase involved in cell wall biosynthesis